MEFNLVEESWIPVLYANGDWRRVGIRQALEDAHRIRQIAASNPMDNVALFRFLLAILYWCRGNPPDDMSHGQFPPAWFKRLDDHKDCFNLLGEGKRFYQDKRLENKKARPIADLLVEFPGKDSVNHMRHVVHDGSYGFCPACCAMGILRLSVWAPANAYYPASVNPGSAAYAIVQENNLFLTLNRYLPARIEQTEDVPWLSNNQPDSPSAVVMLAWRPRRLWLNVGNKQDSCANCGCYDVRVTSLFIEGGWTTPRGGNVKTKKYWDADPHLLRNRDGEPLSVPRLNRDVAVQASRFWRNALQLCFAEPGRVAAIGPIVNDFTFQDAVSIALPDASAQERAKLSDDCSSKLRNLLTQTTPNPRCRHPEINAAFVSLTPDAESRIRTALMGPDTAADNTTFLQELYEPLAEQVVASTISGSPLRRRESLLKAKATVRRVIEQATQVENQPDPSDASRSVGEKKRATRTSRKEANS